MIPLPYLETWLQTGFKEKKLSPDEPDVKEALDAQALLRWNGEGEFFSLHVEIQRALKDLAPSTAQAETCRLLAQTKKWSFESTPNWAKTMQEAAIWASHAEPFRSILENLDILHAEKGTLLNGLGEWQKVQAQYTKALDYYTRALKIKQKALGNDHPHVAKSVNNIGLCYYSQGNYSEALKMHEAALEIWKKALGGLSH